MKAKLTTFTTAAVVCALIPLSASSALGRSLRTHSPQPTLRFVMVQGYQTAVQGRNWPVKRRVTFSLMQTQMGTMRAVVVPRGTVRGLELRTTGAGRFEIGVNGVDPCGSASYTARDFRGDLVHLSGGTAARPCKERVSSASPGITVLKGRLLNIRVKHVDLPRKKNNAVVIRVADAIYIWESGDKQPGYVPTAPEKYFELIGQGTTPPRMCPQVECNAGFYWQWVGMRTGTTSITMNPSCRPSCEIPSYSIPVRIVHRA